MNDTGKVPRDAGRKAKISLLPSFKGDRKTVKRIFPDNQAKPKDLT